jgi:hypothetical protein
LGGSAGDGDSSVSGGAAGLLGSAGGAGGGEPEPEPEPEPASMMTTLTTGSLVTWTWSDWRNVDAVWASAKLVFTAVVTEATSTPSGTLMSSVSLTDAATQVVPMSLGSTPGISAAMSALIPSRTEGTHTVATVPAMTSSTETVAV